MRSKLLLALTAFVLLVPLTAIAAPLEAPASEPTTEDRPHPLADSDGDNISDGLDATLESLQPSDSVDVIATFTDAESAGAAEKTLPPQAITHRFGLIHGFSVTLNPGQIIGLSNHPGIIRIEETFQVTTLNDSANVDFGTALARTDFGVDGTDVGICIADTGLDPGHEQLDDSGKIAGFADFINSSSTPYDDHGHGTHVAATAAGSGTGGANADTYKGVAPGATLYGAKVLSSGGFSSGTSVQDGIEWCASQPGVDIISMSLGSALVPTAWTLSLRLPTLQWTRARSWWRRPATPVTAPRPSERRVRPRR